jgi:NAD(P)-dependent dehydrogenase (short-subunit alcohol dehydrogenase family)
MLGKENDLDPDLDLLQSLADPNLHLDPTSTANTNSTATLDFDPTATLTRPPTATATATATATPTPTATATPTPPAACPSTPDRDQRSAESSYGQTPKESEMATALVTGGGRGIGFELCRQLRARGDAVIATCRKASPELRALDVRVEEDIEVSSDDAPRRLAERLSGLRVDVLVHNAGILTREGLDQLDAEHIRRQFEVNALAPLRITAALLPNLSSGSKVAILTSMMGSIDDNKSGGMYGYRMSKAAVNIAGVSLARDLAPRGVCVALLHPGFVRTDMTGGRGNVDPAESVRGLLARIDELTPETSGGFWHANGKRLPW